MSLKVNEYGRRREIRRQVEEWCATPVPLYMEHPSCYTIPASPDDVFWLLDELAEAYQRMHLILSTIASAEQDTAAKFRSIERLARLDWDREGFSRCP